jgi:hypothetical protein
MAEKTLPAVAPDGTPIEVPASEAGALQRSGGRVMSEAEAASTRRGIELQQKFSGIGGGIEGVVGPLAAGAARGLSVGLSDEAMLGTAEAFGGREGREALRARLNDYQEYAPAASVGGELAGIAAGALMGDEAALGSLPNIVGKIGAGAERVAMRGLGEGAVGKTVGALARTGTEGAVFGMGSAVSESALKDQKLTQEALIGGAAHGFAGGLVVGGLVHGGGAALKALGRAPGAAYDALAARTFGEAAPGVGREMAATEGSLAKAETRAHMPDRAGPYRSAGTPGSSVFDTPAEAAIKVGARGDAEKAAQLGEIWKNREVAFNDAADRIEGHSRDVTSAITDQQKAGRVTDMATFGDAKVNHMEKLVSPSRFGEQSGVVRAWMADAQERLAVMVGDPNSGLSTAAVKRFDGHIQRINAALESGEGHKLFTAADNFKRFLGKEAEFGRVPFGKSEAARAFEDLYQGEGGLMKVLEHESWGKAGEAQKAVNAATSEWIGMGKRFRSKFTTEHGSTMGAPDFVGNSESVNSFMGRLTKAANDLDAQGFRDAVAARRRFLDATEKSYDHGPAASSAIAKERAALDRMEKTFDKATSETALINQMKRLQSEEQAQKIGGLIGLATDTLAKPVTTLQRIAQLEAHTQGVVKKLKGDTSALLGTPKPTEAPGFAPPKGKGQGFFSTLLDKTPTVGLGSVGGAAESKRAQYQRRAEALATLQGNPAQVADRVGNAVGPFATAAPKTVAGATQTAMAGLNFLASKLPPSRRDEFSLQPQLQPRSRASDAEISQFMRYTQAIDDPLVVLREAKSGTLTRDHVEAVKTVYPRLYDEIRGEVMQSLIDSKSPLPYARRIQLGILLDIPTDKTLSPEFLTAIQATYTSAEQAGAESPPPSLTRALNVAGTEQTATQEASGRVQ